ncbi:MAG: hypothetical protein ACK4GL_01510 [Flavobacteriales bacterium]
MQKLLSALFLFAFSQILTAQSHDKGTFSAQLNYDFGVHRTVYTSKFNGFELNRDEGAAATSMLALNFQYNPAKLFSAGFNFNTGAYLENPDNAEAAGNTYRSFFFDLRLYALNKDRFNWFLAPKVGVANLEINRRKGIIVETSNYRATPFGIYSGFNWYPTAIFGLNMQLGYTSHNLKMRSFSVAGTEVNLNNFDNRIAAGGIHLQLGISLKI